ncbi:MAG: DUF5320 domain-containing protein [Verrucomicrobiota bacterium]|nr:DUF5320 domain-containing protein [Verrucomicrobiota bacterium]
MPMGDRTGPWGHGPMTGRAAGYCAGFGAPGYMNRGPGFGFGRGWGRGGGRGGRGWRHWFYATGLTGWQRAAAGWAGWGQPGQWTSVPPENEIDQLRQQAGFLERMLNAIRQRIDQLAPQQAPSQTDKPGDA